MNNLDIVELTLVPDVSKANELLKQGWKFVFVENTSDEYGSYLNYILGKVSK